MRNMNMNNSHNNIIEQHNEDESTKINETVPKLVSMNTKIYLALLLSLVIIVVQGFWINSANIRAEMNTEMIFMKMYPNGTWDVEYKKSGEEADFFPLTIDKLLFDFVEARYGVNPHSMRRNYGFAITFMSPTLRTSFVGSADEDYNAAEKAKHFTQRGWTEEIRLRFIDHFDVSAGSFIGGDSEIYRTNIFIERILRDKSGQQQGDPVKEVINLHWRIKSSKTLNKLTRDELRANPIGIEILKEKITLDISELE
tara:strand:+ start:9458 stop:10222 length:765 start_codon:yes stop_codon:yes gene_type:complete